MGRYSWLIILFFCSGLLACKKQKDSPDIQVQNVYVEFVTSNKIDLNYQLSHLGYQETGVSYYKKSAPSNIISVQALRQGDVLKLSLQGLEYDSEYVFKVFYVQDGERKEDQKEYKVKTLKADAARFMMEIKATSVLYDAAGNFTAEIEGEGLNNMNLSQTQVTVGSVICTLSYPTLISNNKYKLTIKGVVDPVNVAQMIICKYQGTEILRQGLPFVFDGDRDWLTFSYSDWRGYFPSVFNNDLYYFFGSQVFKWDDSGQRMLLQTSIPGGTINDNSNGIQFNGRLFFNVQQRTYYPNPLDLSNPYNYPEAYAYDPTAKTWGVYPLKDRASKGGTRTIRSCGTFVHKSELYTFYCLSDQTSGNPSVEVKFDNIIHHYNKATDKFEAATDLNLDILNYQFISADNQLYLAGTVPVYDQGFRVGATFAIFKVSDAFVPEEVYRGGTINKPQEFILKNVAEYDKKLLFAASLTDFLVYDPPTRRLSKVYLKNATPNMYLGSFFNYNNKLFIGADISFSSQAIYEISLTRGR